MEIKCLVSNSTSNVPRLLIVGTLVKWPNCFPSLFSINNKYKYTDHIPESNLLRYSICLGFLTSNNRGKKLYLPSNVVMSVENINNKSHIKISPVIINMCSVNNIYNYVYIYNYYYFIVTVIEYYIVSLVAIIAIATTFSIYMIPCYFC